MIQSIYTIILSALAVIGLIVLIALGKITWGDAGPLIAAIVGVHGGAAISNTSSNNTSGPIQ